MNVAQFGGNAVVTGTGAGGTGIPRVTISNDSSLAANQSVNVNQIAGAAVSTAASGVQKVGVTGNTGAAMDAAGQNAASPANELLIAGQFNTAPTTITSGNISPLQLDASGNVLTNIKTGNIGVAQGSTTSGQNGPLVQGAVTTLAPTYVSGQTDPLSLDTTGSLRINCTTGCLGATGFATDSSAFTAGTSTFAPTGGVFNDSVASLTSGQQGTARLTADRMMFSNIGKWGGTAVTAKASNTSVTRADVSVPVAVSPNNTGLPVNVPVIVQKASQTSSGSVASINVAFGSNTLAGNSIVVSFCNGNNNKATSPISDTLSNTYTQAGIYAVSGSAFECAIFYVVNIAGGADTVTVTPGGTNASIAMEIYEVSGLLTVTTAQPDNFSNNVTTSSVTASPTLGYGPRTSNTYGFVAFGLGTAAQTITVCNGTGSATCPVGSQLTSDSGQLNPSTPAGLFSMVAASQFLAAPQMWAPAANAGVAEPWAIAAANFAPVELSRHTTNWTQLQPSYSASKSFAASSTTDNAIISANSANPNIVIWVKRIKLTCNETTAGQISLSTIKRSSADSGGTSAVFTVVPDDSRYTASIATINSYTGTGPTAGGLIGNVDTWQGGCLASGTASAGDIYIYNRVGSPIPLRYIASAAEGLAVQLGSQPAGGNITVTFEWLELPSGIEP